MESTASTPGGEQALVSIEQRISQCLRMLEGKSDEHKFAGLLMITKLDGIDDSRMRQVRRQVVEITGVTFFLRLLSTQGDGDGLSPFQVLGLNLIASFCDDSTLVTQFVQEKLVKTVLEQLALMQNPLSVSIHDCVAILQGLVQTQQGKEMLRRESSIRLLIAAITAAQRLVTEPQDTEASNSIHEMAAMLWSFLGVISQDDYSVWTSVLLSDFEFVCFALAQSSGHVAIEVVSVVTNYLQAIENGSASPELFSTQARRQLRAGIIRFLRAKWVGHERDACLRLVYLSMRELGMQWMVAGSQAAEGDVSDGKFVLLVLKLVSIEIKLMLDEVELALLQMEVQTVTHVEEDQRQEQQVQRTMAILPICYGIVECVISGLIANDDSDLPLPHDALLQLKAAFADTIGVVLEHLTAARDFMKTHRYQDLLHSGSDSVDQLDAIVFASVRVTSAWLAEDSDTSIDSVLDLLPFLVCYKPRLRDASAQVSSTPLMDSDDEEAIDSDDEIDATTELLRTATQIHDVGASIDHLHFLLPGLLQISATPDGAKVIAEDVDVLRRALQFACALCAGIASGDEQVGGIPTLTMCLGVLMNLLLLRSENRNALPNASEWHRALSFLLPVACASGSHLMQETSLSEEERGDDDRYVMVLHAVCVVLLITREVKGRSHAVPPALAKLAPRFNEVVAWMLSHPPDESAESATDLLELCRGLVLRSPFELEEKK